MKIQGEILEEAVRDTLRSFKEYLVDESFQRTVAGGEFSGDGAVSVLNSYSTYVLATGVDESAKATILAPDLWVNGSIKITVYFAGSSTNTGDFYVDRTVDAVDLAQALPGDALLASSFAAIASKATAKEVQSFTATTTANVNEDHVAIGLKIRRDGTHASDTSTDDLHILGVVLEYLPANRL